MQKAAVRRLNLVGYRSKVIDREVGRSLGTEDDGKSFIPLGQFGMGCRSAWIGSMVAHGPLAPLALGEIKAFRFNGHLNPRNAHFRAAFQPKWPLGRGTAPISGGETHLASGASRAR